MTVRLRPAAPSFVCVDNGRGKVLFSGTASAPLRFRGRHIRVNIGLATTRLTVNGREIPINSSPAGYDINIHHVLVLPEGKRPCA